MSNKRIQARNWVFTINNYTPEVENRLKELECEWMVFGHEVGENGTPHLQGAIHFAGKRDAKALGKLFPWHLEVMHGTCQDSKTYCTKEDQTGYFEKGIIPNSGTKAAANASKRKWEEAFNAAKEGRFDDIPRDMWVRYKRNFTEIYHDNCKDPDTLDGDDNYLKDHFLWIWGPTGTGKSHTARRIAKELGCEQPYIKALNKWWNGYLHQKVTIIEEANPESCKYLGYYFKQWCDKWSFTAECKGTVISQCRPEYIIVTSNYDIDSCFPDSNDSIPIHRRMTETCLTSRSLEVQWPLTRPQQDLNHQQTNYVCNRQTEPVCGPTGVEPHVVPGNSIPALHPPNDHPDSNQGQPSQQTFTEPPSSQEEADDTQILDFSEDEEEEFSDEITIE